jgi:type I restriction enzyme S subunit
MNSLPPDWKSDRLKDVAIINGTSLPANTDPNYEFDYLEISNVDYFGIIDEAGIERVRFDDAPSRARRRVPEDSILVSSVRPNLQAAAFFPNHHPHLICSTGFNVVQPRRHMLVPRFA